MNDKRIKEPCPFCGTKAEEIQIKTIPFSKGYNKVYCPMCKATFEEFSSKQEAIDKWNRRYKE